ncbi:LBP / BPI / CETP family protein [Ancylostoma ceylanicum]|uniref:LBP / BPI / CETP family protein n=1 Tax=Ancylostoma ceylanicum TaxID=53326 RepID=A0A0D6LWD9_9BILA|nr:LBP / BPI / CETP family protein [Ancylostoma ceylanicum]
MGALNYVKPLKFARTKKPLLFIGLLFTTLAEPGLSYVNRRVAADRKKTDDVIVVLACLVGLTWAKRGGGLHATRLRKVGRGDFRVRRVGIDEARNVTGGEREGEFNPILQQGIRGYPGIRARLGQRAFQYASGMIADVLNQEIIKFRVPPIVQCLPKLNGCVQIYNLYISRYRRPQRVALFPSPPNRIVLQAQNVDFGVTGNLGGQVVILVLMPLTGFIQINIHQATITVETSIERGPRGPYLQVLTCNVTIGYADAYLENGGMIGDAINSLFRLRISNLVRRIIPGQVCGRLPSIVNEKVNSRLADLPRAIAASKIFNMLIGALMGGTGGQTPTAEYCRTHCRGNRPINQTESAQPTAPGEAVVASIPVFVYQRNAAAGPAPAAQFPRAAHNERPVIARGLQQRVNLTNQATVLRGVNTPTRLGTHTAAHSRHRAIQYRSGKEQNVDPKKQSLPKWNDAGNSLSGKLKHARLVRRCHWLSKKHTPFRYLHKQGKESCLGENSQGKLSYFENHLIPQPIWFSLICNIETFFSLTVVKRQIARKYHATNGNVISTDVAGMNGRGFGPVTGGFNSRDPRLPPTPSVPAVSPKVLAPSSTDLCAKCPVNGSQSDPMSLLRTLFSSLDMRKLNDLYLSLQLLNIQATSNDFTVDITGECSPDAQAGTPFGPFPTTFPPYNGSRMVELILSDYSINSLLYWMHKKQFLSLQIGPETPQLGGLLKTTCTEDEDVEATKVHVRYALPALRILSVEIDEDTHRYRARKISKKTLRAERAESMRRKGNRGKRLDLGDLGDTFCIGQFLPEVKTKYPNQTFTIYIKTTRAPSVIFNTTQGGTVTVDAIVDADIHITETNYKLGTFTASITMAVTAQLRGNRLTGSAQITNLKITDKTGSMLMTQDSLDGLASLLKDNFTPVLNDALKKGITINIPTSGLFGLPISLVNPEVRISEHGLYIATDMTISPSFLGLGGRQRGARVSNKWSGLILADIKVAHAALKLHKNRRPL